MHQNDDYNTFEELRILPALQNGVIVICENSPLSEMIPYNDYIIWSKYENILDKVNEVINKYDYYHDFIFYKEKKHKLDDFNNINYDNLNKIINVKYNNLCHCI
jgi:hypothetical protein